MIRDHLPHLSDYNGCLLKSMQGGGKLFFAKVPAMGQFIGASSPHLNFLSSKKNLCRSMTGLGTHHEGLLAI